MPKKKVVKKAVKKEKVIKVAEPSVDPTTEIHEKKMGKFGIEKKELKAVGQEA